MPYAGSRLDKMLTQLGTLLAKSESWLEIYKEIGSNVEGLKQARVDHIFGLFQMASTSLLAVEIYNIYDCEPNYEIVSLPKILNELKKEEYQIQNECALLEGLASLSITSPPSKDLKNNLITSISKRRPNFKSDRALKRVKDIRDNYIAHINAEQIIQKATLPSDTEFERLIRWANTFRIAIYDGFFPQISPAPIETFSSVTKMQLRRVVKKVVKVDDTYSFLTASPDLTESALG